MKTNMLKNPLVITPTVWEHLAFKITYDTFVTAVGLTPGGSSTVHIYTQTRKCGAKKESSAHIFCECEALASLRHIHLGSFFLDPEDIRVLGVGAIWKFVKGTGLL